MTTMAPSGVLESIQLPKVRRKDGVLVNGAGPLSCACGSPATQLGIAYLRAAGGGLIIGLYLLCDGCAMEHVAFGGDLVENLEDLEEEKT